MLSKTGIYLFWRGREGQFLPPPDSFNLLGLFEQKSDFLNHFLKEREILAICSGFLFISGCVRMNDTVAHVSHVYSPNWYLPSRRTKSIPFVNVTMHQKSVFFCLFVWLTIKYPWVMAHNLNIKCHKKRWIASRSR